MNYDRKQYISKISTLSLFCVFGTFFWFFTLMYIFNHLIFDFDDDGQAYQAIEVIYIVLLIIYMLISFFNIVIFRKYIFIYENKLKKSIYWINILNIILLLILLVISIVILPIRQIALKIFQGKTRWQYHYVVNLVKNLYKSMFILSGLITIIFIWHVILASISIHKIKFLK